MQSRVAAGAHSFGRVGETISGKFRIVRGLGEGAAGCVYLAENVELGRPVALKVLHPVLARSGEATGRFRREAQAAAAIRHANIVDVLDMGRTDDGVPYFVMELLEGETLRELLDRSGALPAARAVDIAQQVLSALSAAHSASIVHRDLKPSNVFIARQGSRDVVKVLDFGVAKYRHDASSPLGGADCARMIVGTPHYMSPEQARGKSDVDGTSDLYSVGVLLFEMISACRPHEGASPEEILDSVATKDPPPLGSVAPGVPDELARVVGRALARDPAQRFARADELRAALVPFADTIDLGDIDIPSQPVDEVPSRAPTAPRPGTGEGGGDPRRAEPTLVVARPRSRRRWVVALPVVAVAIATVSAWTLLGTGSSPTRPAHTITPPSGGRALAGPFSVSLAVDSSVPGARVLLDGRPVGVTPLRTTVAAGGPGLVRVEAEGHRPSVLAIDLSRAVRVFADLKPRQPPPVGRVTEGRRSEPDRAVAGASARASPIPRDDESGRTVPFDPRTGSGAGTARSKVQPGPREPRTRATSVRNTTGPNHPGSVIFDPFAP